MLFTLVMKISDFVWEQIQKLGGQKIIVGEAISHKNPFKMHFYEVKLKNI